MKTKFVILGGHHTLQHWLKNVEWGGGSENPDDKVKLTFHAQGGLRFLKNLVLNSRGNCMKEFLTLSIFLSEQSTFMNSFVKKEEYTALPDYSDWSEETFEDKFDADTPLLSLPKSEAKQKKHSPPLKKMCPECGLNVYNLTNHIIGVHGNEKHECPHCQLVFKTKPRLDKHVKWVHEKTPCELCGELVGNLSRHMINVHEDQKHQCPHCQAVFKSKDQLQKHNKRVHEKTPCEQCGELVGNLSRHMASIHSQEKIPCPHCHLVFRSKDQLKKHIAWTHDKVQCEQCGDMVGKGKMQRHITSKHTSIYDKRFKCEICGKSFDRNAKLKDHKNTHTGEKPYQCKFCSACFASIGTHAMHQRSHLGHRRTK